jgi:cyclophilin family peptidyl-prolyl cis-trans isomerase
MSRRTRRKQLDKLAARRAAERRRRRRQRVVAGTVAGALALGAVGYAGWVFLFSGDEDEPARPQAAPSPSPSPSTELPVACGAEIPPTASTEKPQYANPPRMRIDPQKEYTAVIDTSCGPIRIELMARETPETVNSFVFLARETFYDGLTFHRVEPGFVIQGGDPSGSGTGGPGYAFEDEIVDRLTFDQPGLLAMANSGPNTNGSQFFITLGPAEHLNGMHTIFGRVRAGMSVAREIESLGAPGGSTSARIFIERIRIIER